MHINENKKLVDNSGIKYKRLDYSKQVVMQMGIYRPPLFQIGKQMSALYDK